MLKKIRVSRSDFFNFFFIIFFFSKEMTYGTLKHILTKFQYTEVIN